MIKDPNALIEVEQVVKDEMKTLKLLHTVGISKSENYPVMDWSDFEIICNDCKLTNKVLKKADLDRQFIAADCDVTNKQINN